MTGRKPGAVDGTCADPYVVGPTGAVGPGTDAVGRPGVDASGGSGTGPIAPAVDIGAPTGGDAADRAEPCAAPDAPARDRRGSAARPIRSFNSRATWRLTRPASASSA